MVTSVMVFICNDCGQEFLSSSEYEHHQQTYLQTHLDKWSNKEEPKSYPPPQGLNMALYKILEQYKMDDTVIWCLWQSGQANTAIREPSRKLELLDILKE